MCIRDRFNADGSVLSTATYPIAGIGPSIVAVDLNKDGVPDLAATETDPSGQGNLVVLLGKGDGTFRPPAKFAAGVYAFYLATADFNGDGAPDIAITNLPSTATGAGQVSVCLLYTSRWNIGLSQCARNTEKDESWSAHHAILIAGSRNRKKQSARSYSAAD